MRSTGAVWSCRWRCRAGELLNTLISRGRARAYGKCGDAILRYAAAELMATDRGGCGVRISVTRACRYIDLLRAVIEQAQPGERTTGADGKIAKFALKKHPDEPMR